MLHLKIRISSELLLSSLKVRKEVGGRLILNAWRHKIQDQFFELAYKKFKMKNRDKNRKTKDAIDMNKFEKSSNLFVEAY